MIAGPKNQKNKLKTVKPMNKKTKRKQGEEKENIYTIIYEVILLICHILHDFR